MAILRVLFSKQLSQCIKMKPQSEQDTVSIGMMTEKMEAACEARASHNRSKFPVALAAVVGLLVAALGGFFLHQLVFSPVCAQAVEPTTPSATLLNFTFKPKETEKKQYYDIFTAGYGTNYSVFGWLEFPNVTNETVTLFQIRDEQVTEIKPETINRTKIFFSENVYMCDKMTIGMHSKTKYKESIFYVIPLEQR